MKKYLLTCSFWLLALSVINAQDNSDITLQLPITQRADTNTNIQSIEIVSNLADSNLIGVLPSVYPNVRTNVIIAEGVQSWLQNYNSQQFANSLQADGKKILWTIKEMRVGKDSAANRCNSFTILTADIYLENMGSYELAPTFDTVIFTTDKTTDFAQYMTLSINALFDNSVKAVNQQMQERQAHKKI